MIAPGTVIEVGEHTLTLLEHGDFSISADGRYLQDHWHAETSDFRQVEYVHRTEI